MSKIWGALLFTSLAMTGGACGDDHHSPIDAAVTPDTPMIQCATDTTKAKVQLGGLIAMTVDPSAPLYATSQEQFELVASDINNNCGVLGDATGGVGIQFTYKDTEAGGAIADTVTNELL